VLVFCFGLDGVGSDMTLGTGTAFGKILVFAGLD
jgi:hypothetical protein